MAQTSSSARYLSPANSVGFFVLCDGIFRLMRFRKDYLIAAVLAVFMHGVFVWLFSSHPKLHEPQERIFAVELVQPPPAPEPVQPAPVQNSEVPNIAESEMAVATEVITPPREPASMTAPMAPTAEEWALASTYTLKNSKRYRYNWGQQVRSMMGTAVEGADQGVVRFRVEITPDGKLAKLETLWTTSEVAEKLARKAIESMPPLPPTPTGQPLVFERTISFQPFAADGPPVYRDDCLPDPPVFRNRFAWDGKSAKVQTDPPIIEKPDPKALAECMKQLPTDTIEAESAQNKREFDQWRSSKSGG